MKKLILLIMLCLTALVACPTGDSDTAADSGTDAKVEADAGDMEVSTDSSSDAKVEDASKAKD